MAAEDDGGAMWTQQKRDRRGRKESEPLENGYVEEEPDFSDSEDYVDDATEEGKTGLFLV